MGNLSLIIVVIIVVWVIVLAPIFMGGNKPIRRSGKGYDAPHVVLEGGSEPVAKPRRRPRLTAADVHNYSGNVDHDYELVEAEEPATESTAVAVLEAEEPAEELVDGEVVDELRSGSTALSVLQAADEAADSDQTEDQEFYDLDEAYEAPSDFGYPGDDYFVETTPETAEDIEEDNDSEDQDEETDLSAEEIEFAQNRSGRGGWDPERERAMRADRYRRRQLTLAGLIIADVIAFVAAFVAGGWAWVVPAVTIGLTVWFIVVAHLVVKQEHALHARRVRRLRRARLGVVSEDAGSPARRRPGSVIVELDDDSPDFRNVDTYYPETADNASSYEYDDYNRAS